MNSTLPVHSQAWEREREEGEVRQRRSVASIVSEPVWTSSLNFTAQAHTGKATPVSRQLRTGGQEGAAAISKVLVSPLATKRRERGRAREKEGGARQACAE